MSRSGSGLVLGIETSCDETAVAVVERGRRVLANRVASQVDLHARHGGVVPEIASRAHLEQMVAMAEGALGDAGVRIDGIEAVAVTRGPGLIGCLLVGVEFGKALATSRGLPLVGVQHVAGHLDSPWIGRDRDAWGNPVTEPREEMACVGLCVSGGHSSIVYRHADGRIEGMGETLDDAVGEAYDKVAKLLGLGYPGGPVIDRIAAEGDPEAFALPRPLKNKPGYDFSFSGLKTAVRREVEKHGAGSAGPEECFVRDLCASFQAACIDTLLGRCERALADRRAEALAVVGGVAANRALRAALGERFGGIRVAIPDFEFCTDNGAMIAGAGWGVYTSGVRAGPRLTAMAQLDIASPPAAWQG